jgi:hypothetical protein
MELGNRLVVSCMLLLTDGVCMFYCSSSYVEFAASAKFRERKRERIGSHCQGWGVQKKGEVIFILDGCLQGFNIKKKDTSFSVVLNIHERKSNELRI